MISLSDIQFVYRIIFIWLIISLVIAVPVFAEDSQNIGGIGFSLPSELKDKSPNHDLLLFANVITAHNDTNEIPIATSRQQYEWLDRIMKSKWVDPRIREECVSYLSPIKREGGKTPLVSSQPIQHYGEPALLYNYQIESYKFTIVDVGERLSFLIRISDNIAGNKSDIGAALDHVSNIFNVNPEFINIMRSNLVENAGTYVVMIDEKKYEHGIQINANIYSRVVCGLFSAKSVFLSFDGLMRKSKGRSGMGTIRKDSCEKVRFQEQKSVIKEIASQQSTNELTGVDR